MRRHPLHVLAALLAVPALAAPALLMPVAGADARPVLAHHRVVSRGAPHHHHVGRRVAGRAARSPAPYGYIDSVPQDPRYGYEEAPYDPHYDGPGADVFAATKARARDAGLLHELAPDAKVSATGIVVGGGL